MNELAEIRKRGEAEERAAILAALEQTKGNVTQAAKLMNIGRFAMFRRIKKYKILEKV